LLCRSETADTRLHLLRVLLRERQRRVALGRELARAPVARGQLRARGRLDLAHRRRAAAWRHRA